MMRLLLLAVFLWLPAAQAQLSIEITGAGAQRIPLAIVPFAGESAAPPPARQRACRGRVGAAAGHQQHRAHGPREERLLPRARAAADLARAHRGDERQLRGMALAPRRRAAGGLGAAAPRRSA